MMEDIFKKCRSYRRFDEGVEVSSETLKELVGLARYSPTAANRQALKFILSCSLSRNDLIFPALKWAGYLKEWKGPAKGERPAAYIVILGDKEITGDFSCDHAIAAHGILLGAVEKGLGGCIIGAIDKEMLRAHLDMSHRYEILLVVAVGRPVEEVVLEDIGKDGDIRYYRDDKGVHHVPKRTLEELIME